MAAFRALSQLGGDGLESDEHWLGLQDNTPDLFPPLLDGVLESHDVGGSCVPTVHDSQCMLARDANRSVAVAPAKAGMFDQPGGGNFFLCVQRGIAGNLQVPGGGP